jgi:Na+/H+-dicarboxylate symporter
MAGKKLPLYAKILIAMLIGLVWGLSAQSLGLTSFTNDWIKPFGDIFIRSLKLIAIPLVIVSLIDGVSNLSDVTKLSRLGGKTIALYLCTTVIAVTIGLLTVNLIKPGTFLSEERRDFFRNEYAGDLDLSAANATADTGGPLQMLVDIVPENLFFSISGNTNMLQVIFFAILFGVATILTPREKVATVKSFFDGTNRIILAIVDIIMMYAPVGVFALLASMKIDIELIKTLGVYSLNVVLALAVMTFLVYPSLLKIFTKVNFFTFFKGILPAQILAFSTSSSAATLPVTLKCVENNLGVSEEVSSFVLPLGATINMDGTSIHQGVSAVFIAQAFGIALSLEQQLTILLTAVLASIGTAAVPGAGIIMLIIVLQSVGLDPAGLALILAVDRPLDMLRTVVNITGDAAVASTVASSEDKLDVGIANNLDTEIRS